MNKKLRNIGKYLFWIAVSVALLYFSFRHFNLADFKTALQYCHWEYIVLSMLLGAFVIFVRALRWRMLLLPLDPSTSILTCWNAYNICMIVNLALPRAGEIARCGYITRHSVRDDEGNKLASLDKVIGTVVLDRVWDVVSFLIIAVILFFVFWDQFGSFITGTLLGGMASKVSLLWVIVVAGALILLFVWLCWRLRERGKIWGKVWGWIQGLWEGLLSCLHMKNGGLFIVYTAIIWCCYWLMSACVLRSLQNIDAFGTNLTIATDDIYRLNELGLVDAFFLMFVGSVSSLIPVPGGFGVYHAAISWSISSVYGISEFLGKTFAILSHESQVIVNAFCGACSYVHETFFRR